MKIDDKDFPILKALRTNNKDLNFPMMFDSDLEYKNGFYECMILDRKISEYRELLKGNVFYITKTYIEAMKRSAISFAKSITTEDLNELYKEFMPINKLILFKQPYSENNGESNISILIVANSLDDMKVWAFADDTLVASIFNIKDKHTEFATMDKNTKGCMNDNLFILSFMNTINLFLLMEKYAKVETKISKALSQQKDEQLGVISNSTKCDIKIRDSKWFTTICRDEGFMVRGHFRLQPKKINGEWTKELIYINEFEKHGYHRQAEILNKEQ
jgi:hypothetical protein